MNTDITNSNWKRFSLVELTTMVKEIRRGEPNISCYDLLCAMSARILAENFPQEREGFLVGALPTHHRISINFADEMLIQNGIPISLWRFDDKLKARIAGVEQLLFLDLSDQLFEFYRRKLTKGMEATQRAEVEMDVEAVEFTDEEMATEMEAETRALDRLDELNAGLALMEAELKPVE